MTRISPKLKTAIMGGMAVIADRGSLRQAIKSFIELEDRIEKHPFYEFTKDDRSLLTAMTVLLVSLYEVLHGKAEDEDEG